MSATIVVQFGQGADSSALVKVELDDLVNIDAEGNVKTSFEPGDQPVFLVHHDATLRIGGLACSSGSIQSLGQVGRDRKQQLIWPELTAQQLEYLPNADPVFTWYGNNAGVARVERTLTPSGTVPAVCDVAIPILASQYRLLPPPLDDLEPGDEWPILIVVTMEAA